MTSLSRSLRKTGLKVQKHSPEILTGLGIAGFVSSVFMVAKAAPKAEKLKEEIRSEMEADGFTEKEIKVQEVKDMVPIFLPTAIMCVASTACIIGANRIGAKRQATLAAAYAISEGRFKEYQEKVIEKLGERKEQTIRDEICKDEIEKNPPKESDLILDEDEILCYDKVIGRYFKSDVNAIRKAETIINRRLISEMYISLNEFYDELDLEHVEIGDDLGWTVDEIFEISFSSQLTANNTPCLVISYDYVPKFDYMH